MKGIRIGKGKPLHWIIWHPYQGLWNWTLHRALRRIIPGDRPRRWALSLLVTLDTLILWLRAIRERWALVGYSRDLWAPRLPPDPCVLYLDAGTHREARELRWVVERVLPRYTSRVRAVGFEAGTAFYRDAVAHTAHLPCVQIVHAALCYQPPPTGTVRLYVSPADGRASSLYREDFRTYEDVPALSLSRWLREQGISLDDRVIILRMNIEGAEEEVIRDLVERGVAEHVDGFFGMWDDVAKDDPERGKAFRRTLKRLGIRPFTFNDRDFRSRWRMQCVEYALVTALLRGTRRKRGAQCDEEPSC